MPAAAAALTSTHKNELLLFYTLLELTLIVVAGRVGGILAKRCGQSTAVGEIIIGICLGPSLFGLLAPRAFDYGAPPSAAWTRGRTGVCVSPSSRRRPSRSSAAVIWPRAAPASIIRNPPS